MAKEENELAPYEVFAGTAWEAGLLKSILEDNDIETLTQQASSLQWDIMPTNGATIKVFVAYKDYVQAKEIVKEFYSNMEIENTDDDNA